MLPEAKAARVLYFCAQVNVRAAGEATEEPMLQKKPAVAAHVSPSKLEMCVKRRS